MIIGLKYVCIILLFFACIFLGRLFAKKFIMRLKELEEMKSALNVFETKVKFTYEPIPEIFGYISENDLDSNISKIFNNAKNKMRDKSASDAWLEALNESEGNLNKEDINVLKNFSKLLGQTDIEGQVSQIKITQEFLQKQIDNALVEKQRNEKLYNKLGIVVGLMLIIILI